MKQNPVKWGSRLMCDHTNKYAKDHVSHMHESWNNDKPHRAHKYTGRRGWEDESAVMCHWPHSVSHTLMHHSVILCYYHKWQSWNLWDCLYTYCILSLYHFFAVYLGYSHFQYWFVSRSPIDLLFTMGKKMQHQKCFILGSMWSSLAVARKNIDQLQKRRDNI